MLLWSPYAVYAILVLVVGLSAAWWLAVWLGRLARARERLINARPQIGVLSSRPEPGAREEARRESLERVQKRFTVQRGILVPGLLLVTALLVLVPLAGDVPAQFLSLLIAAITVVLGLALRPVIENLAAGLVLSWSDHVRVGDVVVVDGLYGTVEDITATHTTIKLWDWRRLVLANADMLRTKLTNYSLHDRWIWANVTFHVAPDADLQRVRALAIEALRGSPSFSHPEEPRFWVTDLGATSTECMVAGWAETPSASWSLTSDTRTRLVAALRAAGIASHGFHVSGPLASA